jgi:very-short-patch-repair endonuclease
MGAKNGQRAWDLAGGQWDVISRAQLLALGYSDRAIKHRVSVGRLFPMWPGIYAVGSPHTSWRRVVMGAVLACGEGAATSHGTAGHIFGVRQSREIHVSVPVGKHPRPAGVIVHRRAAFEVTKHRGIPVTTPVCTIVDMAPDLTRDELEHVINQADVKGLVTVPALNAAVQDLSPRPGLKKVRQTIDRRTFTFTRSGLERAFKPIARRAGLPQAETCVYVNGYEVDFFFRELGIVVETDGGTFHRSPAQQAIDRRRDHAHSLAELLPLRFTHGQIRYEPSYVEETLTRAGRLQALRRAQA